MFGAMYSAATGMNIAAQAHEITADNLAHVNHSGFRQRGVVYETFDRVLQQAGTPSAKPQVGAQVAQGYTDFRQGAFEQTGSPLDLALAGDGFFTLQGNNGPVYTRDGVFLRAPDGRIVNSNGLPLLGARGPITVPRQATNILISGDGNVLADGIPVDRIQVSRFGRIDQLNPVGTCLYEAPDTAQRSASNATVLQGVREKSNVEMASAMTALVREIRYFEASQRALRAISEVTQLATRPG